MNTKYLQFKKNLYNKDVNKKVLFDFLKINYSFSEQEYIINKTPRVFESLIFGTPFFSSIIEFGKRKLDYFESEETELNWYVHLFKKYSGELNLFLEKKKAYEINFLLGNYSKSGEILDEIKSITFSYWGLENKFLQTQYEKGLEFNLKLLNRSKNQEVSDPAFFYLVHFFSNKVEEDISYFSYINALENSINWGMSKDYKSYFLYRLNSVSHDFHNKGGLLWASSNLSLIDKYMLYKDIVASILSKQPIEEEYYFIKTHCIYLSNYLEDSFFSNALFFAFKENQKFTIKENDEIRLIDLFTLGKYDDVILNSKRYFLKNVSFCIIEIYVKSHLHLGKDLQHIGDNKSVLNVLLRLTYNILLREKISNEAVIELLTIANALSSFHISKEIVAFLNYHISKENNIETRIKSFLFSKDNNPIYFDIFENVDSMQSYLKRISEDNSITVDFFQEILNDTNIKRLEIPEYRISFYSAINYFNNKNYKSCKLEIEKILKEVENISYLKEQCLKLLFFSFVELLEYNNAIDLYVNNYILSPLLVSKINAEKLSEIIVRTKWKNINHSNINFPIFIYLSHSDIHPKYISYDLYMRTQNILTPSKLHEIEGLEFAQKIFFLKNIATPKIISRKAIVFKNSTDVLKERISICQYLSKIDERNNDEYNKEISDITQRLTVQQRIKEIDESKIYIDENGILEKELTEVQKGFNRFRNISQLLKESNIDATGIGYDALYDLLKGNIDADTYKTSIRKTDIHFELFTQLFLEIRDKFLFSNQYGLDYYLSQRIRHGTIINQLRKSFKTYNLITTKSSKSEGYLPNIYWVNKLDIKNETKTEFEQRLNLFSSNIDNIISNLKNKYIQIKTEDPKTNQTGWFDYMYIPLWNSTWLYSLFIKELQFFTDFEGFVKSIFEILWEITGRNLSLIRERLNQEVKNELISELDKLEVELKRLLPNKEGVSLFRSIAECRTNIQADVDYVITWFNKSKNDEIDFTFDDALNTSLQIVNNIISPNTLDVKIQNNTSKQLIKGMYFTHFVDLTKIFLTNIYDYYSKVEIEDKETTIVASEENGLLVLVFSNSLREEEDINNLKSIIRKKQDEAEKHIKGIRGEGSTGFPKANNILKNVFKNNNLLDFDINKEKFIVKCEIQLNNLIV